ncbi:MAG: LysM peptidoglycan-binding domain-containing protein [Deltaproteobacteria bacterium]|jgi:hypothetical protein|nr:LysM peptidoglycan-binding domain-containing protein [Deltaproteobacteria bacterium]
MARPLIVIFLALGLALLGLSQGYSQDGAATQTYVVQKGDTLSKIAKKFYNKASLGSRLWRANQNLVAHPKRLTPGDVLYIFPESTLALNTPISVPPAPEAPPQNLYPQNEYMRMSFPKYFSFVSDLQSHANTTRVKVKKIVPRTVTEIDPETGEPVEVTSETMVDELYEVRIVGEIIASQERGATIRDDGFSAVATGRTLLSTGDTVMVRFSEDLAKIMDSDTYDDSDPYFTAFPVYSPNVIIQEPDRKKADYARSLGNLMYFKGRINIVSRVEGLAPPVPRDASRAKNRAGQSNQDLEDVSYVARITYSEDAIYLGDKVVLFVPLKPGPERRLDSPYVEQPDSYRAPGK